MAGSRKDIQIQMEITNDEQWEETLSSLGLLVIDVYQKWCGPCKAVQSLFKKLKTQYGDDMLKFAVAEADSIIHLRSFRGKCQPVFLFYNENKLLSVIKGVKGPLLQRTIIELVEEERKKQELGSNYVCKINEVFLQECQGTKQKDAVPQSDQIDISDQWMYYVVIIKPDAVVGGQVEEVKQKVVDAGYSILTEESKILNEEQIQDFYQDKVGDVHFLTVMSSELVHVLILLKKVGQREGCPTLSDLIDPVQAELIKTQTRSNEAMEVNLEIATDSKENASRQLGFFFPSFSLNGDIPAVKQDSDTQIQRTVALIRPSLLQEKKEEILQTILDSGFQVAMQREVVLTEEQAKEFYKEHEGTEYFPCLIKHMTSGPVLALALIREDAVQHWRDAVQHLLGSKILEESKEKSPDSLCARFAIDDIQINQLHGSSSIEEAERDLACFFPVEQTLAVIKPDTSQEHKDDIIKRFKEAGFTISQIKETHLTREMAEKFYGDHKGKGFFNALVDNMSQGPSVMMILSKENAIAEWRELILN